MKKTNLLIIILPLFLFGCTQSSTTNTEEIPKVIKSLCQQEEKKSTEFITESGYQATFFGKAVSAYKCEGGIWEVSEGRISEGGTFYFDSMSNFIDICQLLFHSDVCKQYENLPCGDKNYCL